MLADPTFAEIVQSIGQASLGADDATIKHLTKVHLTAAIAVTVTQLQLPLLLLEFSVM